MLCAARARGPTVADYSTITPSLCMESPQMWLLLRANAYQILK